MVNVQTDVYNFIVVHIFLLFFILDFFLEAGPSILRCLGTRMFFYESDEFETILRYNLNS